jgi:hypothetical protein
MNRLEIIHLRTSGEPLETISALIRTAVNNPGPDTPSITVYCRDDLGSDVAVHLLHPDHDRETGKSVLGLHLCAALKEYGLVKHTVWDEMHPDHTTRSAS